jgi:hypothetical protein
MVLKFGLVEHWLSVMLIYQMSWESADGQQPVDPQVLNDVWLVITTGGEAGAFHHSPAD